MKKALYLYCVVSQLKHWQGDLLGVSGENICPVYHRDLALLVHECKPIPYSSKDSATVVKWVKAHGRVVETAWEIWEDVCPFSFNTIIRATPKKNALDNAITWLDQNYDRILKKIRELSGKAEFGVQIFWDRKITADRLLQQEPSLVSLQTEMTSKNSGTRFLLEQKLHKELRALLERTGSAWVESFLDKITSTGLRYQVEKPKEGGSILNLCCLDARENPKLGDILEEAQKQEGIRVRFTGPWPPYSFSSLG